MSGSGAGDGGPAEGGAVPRGMRARLPGGRSLAGAGRTGGRDGRRDLLFRWRPDGTYRRRRGGSHATPGGAADGSLFGGRICLSGGAGVRVETISALLDRYGQCVTLYRGGVEAGREVRAFLQPLREAGREQARPSPLGLRREDR